MKMKLSSIAKAFLPAAALAILLASGLVLAGCKTNDDPGPPPFDGSTLAGTTWTATEAGVPFTDDDLTADRKVTIVFTSNTEGTYTMEITKFNGEWTDQQKTGLTNLVNIGNGAITSTYDPTAKTGTITKKVGIPATFTVNVDSRELTMGEITFKLQ